MRLHECENLNERNGNSSVCSVVVLVVVQPGDQLLSPERRTNTPQAAREDEVDANTQSTSYLVSLGA